MRITWKQVTGSQQSKPSEIDTISSPSTVYLRRNIEKTEITNDDETISVWKYDEAQLTREEYEGYLKVSQIFQTPEMERMKEKLATQELSIAALAADAEYTACMLDMAGII